MINTKIIGKIKSLYIEEEDAIKKGKLFLLYVASLYPKIEMEEKFDALVADINGLQSLILCPNNEVSDETLNYIKSVPVIFVIENEFSERWIEILKNKRYLVGKIFYVDMDSVLKENVNFHTLILYKIYRTFILGLGFEDTIFNKELYNNFENVLKSSEISLDNRSIDNILSSLSPDEHPRNLIKNPYVNNLENALQDNNVVLLSGKSASGKTSIIFEYSYYRYAKTNEKIYYIDVTLLQNSDVPNLFLDLFGKLIDDNTNSVLLIVDDLHANLSVTYRLIEIVNIIHCTNLSYKLKFVGIVWPEFVISIKDKFEEKVEILEISSEYIKERLISRLPKLQDLEKQHLMEYVEDNLLLLFWSIKLLKDRGITVKDLPKELPDYVYRHIQNKATDLDNYKIKKILFLTSVFGQYEIDITTEFIEKIVNKPNIEELIEKLIERKILRVKGQYITLGHRSYCKIVFDFLAKDEHIVDWMIDKLQINNITELILEYLYTLDPPRIWSILKKIYMYTGIKTTGNVIVDIWKDMDYLIEKILYQQSLDPTWNRTPSSAMFVVQALSEVGYREKAKDSIEFLRSIYSIDHNSSMKISIQTLSTVKDFRNIKNAMSEQDKKEKIWGEKGEDIDESIFHTNWVSGLILCAEAYYGELSKDKLLRLAQSAEKNAEKDDKGETHFYPARVPWCTARVLIGLGLCGRNVKTSDVVRKISEWLLNHPNYNDGIWMSGTGEWNIETTALVIQALLHVGVSPKEEKIQKAVHKLYEARNEWTQKGKEIDGVTALQAYSYAGGDLTKVLNEVIKLAKWGKDAALWINATKPSDETLKQSCLVSQTASGLIDVMWRYIKEDLPLLLEHFDMKITLQKRFTIFISYSQEEESHNNWVYNLAENLLKNGYEVIIDRKNLEKYKDMTQFMERSIEKADIILVICTPTYKQKADERVGGVGYEARIISYEIYRIAMKKEKKFIPILRKGTSDNSIPNYLKGYECIDFRDDNAFDSQLRNLIKKLNKNRR